MKQDYEVANLQEYSLGNLHQHVEMTIYTLICFFIPFFIGHPQIVVGVIVNAALVLAALNLKGYKLLPVIIAPSLGVLAKGLLFGPFTIYLLYMIPFIWIGNTILVFSFKWIKLRLGKNYLSTLIAGAGLKSGFLFLSALLLYKLGIIPVVFLAAMGIMQLYTALGGGAAAYIVHNAKKRFA
jgi:hypothetical protein